MWLTSRRREFRKTEKVSILLYPKPAAPFLEIAS